MADEEKKETKEKQEQTEEVNAEESAKEASTLKGFEERLEKAAEKISKTMTDSAKRMEAPISDKYKSLYNSPAAGFILILVGVIWFLYTVGFFNSWPFPIILIILGILLVLKRKPKE